MSSVGKNFRLKAPSIEAVGRKMLRNRDARIRRALQKRSGDVVELSKQLTPEATGALASAIRARPVKVDANSWRVEIYIDESVQRISNGRVETVGSYVESILERYHTLKPGVGTQAKAAALGVKAGGAISDPSRSTSRAVTEFFLQRAINILSPQIRQDIKKAAG